MTPHTHGYLGASTKIALIDGHVTTIGDIAASWPRGVRRYTYSHDDDGRSMVHLAMINSARRALLDTQRVLCVTLDDGSVIDCTPAQAFLTDSDAWEPASRLKPGQALRTVQDLQPWTWRSSPVDIPVAYSARRRVADVSERKDSVEVFEFALNKGDSVAHPSGIFLRS